MYYSQPMAKPKTTKPIKSYTHSDKERTNNPPAGLVTAEGDPDLPAQTYEHLKPPPPPIATRRIMIRISTPD